MFTLRPYVCMTAGALMGAGGVLRDGTGLLVLVIPGILLLAYGWTLHAERRARLARYRASQRRGYIHD